MGVKGEDEIGKNYPLYVGDTFKLSGCAALENLDDLAVIGDYSREKDNQHRLVKFIDDHYDALTRAIAQGHISDYKDKASLVTFFWRAHS